MCEPGSSAAHVLAAAIDTLLALDPAALGDQELHETVTALRAELSRLAAADAALVREWDTRRIWADDGSKSAASRLSRDCDLAKSTARVSLKRARKLHSMPATADALRNAKLSADQADLLAMANQPDLAALFARDVSMLVDSRD